MHFKEGTISSQLLLCHGTVNVDNHIDYDISGS